MAIYQVFSHSVSFKYKSTLCSKSAIFSIATTFLTVTLPFLLAYRSHGFWLRSTSYREQPQVHFKHDYLLYMETEEIDSPVLCSNLPVTQKHNYCTVIKVASSELMCVVAIIGRIKTRDDSAQTYLVIDSLWVNRKSVLKTHLDTSDSREEDSNLDGYYDELIMEFELEIPPTVSVYSAQIVLLFDYVLQKRYLLQMESAGFIQFTSGLPLHGLSITGDLRLVQKHLLGGRGRDTRYNASVFGLSDDPTSMLDLQETMKSYGRREVTTVIQNVYRTWTRGSVANEPFTVSLNIMYPEETIHYRPPFWQIVKWAWMQYLALLIIFAYVCRSVKRYVFSNHLVPTVKEIPWKKLD